MSGSSRTSLPRCNLCASERIAVYHDQGYRCVVKCRDCRFVFVDPLPTPEQKAEIERLAYDGDMLPEVADFFRNCHRDFKDDPVIEAFRHGLRWLGAHRKPGRLLDVGPGTGIFLHLARAEFGWEPFGIDICQESADKARAEFGIVLQVGDFDTYPWEPAGFDAVTMLDMLEHTLDPAASLRRAWQLLKPGGVLYIAVPNQHCLMTVLLDWYIRMRGPGYGFFLERLYVPPHVYYFNPETLRSMLERAGFETVEVCTGNVYLGRYRLKLGMRILMELVLKTGRLAGMGAKVLALARKPEVSGDCAHEA